MPSKITSLKQIRGIATSKLLGRLTAGTGQAEELSSANILSWLSVYTIAQIDSGSITFTALPQSSAVPSSANDLVNKAYVDTFATGLTIKEAVRVATTVPGTLATSFEDGDLVDAVTLATGDRILIKNQVAGEENGVYVVEASGAPTRATDSNTSAEVIQGTFMLVLEGTANANKQFVQTAVSPTLGTNSLVYSQLSAPTVYTGSLGVQLVGADFRANFVANDGLKLSTNSLTVAYDDSSIGIVSNLLSVKALGITNAMLAGSIVDTKLSQLTTAEKVSGTALTGLASTPSVAGIIPVANLGSGTPSASNFLRGDGTYAVPTGISAGVATINYTKMQDTSSSNVTVTNTATETTIYTYSVPANTLGTNRALRFTLNGTYLNNSAANRTVTVRVKYGATTILTKVSPTIPTSATTGSFAIEGFVAAQNSASIQTGYMWVSFEGGDDITRWVDDKGSAAEDSTGALNLVVTVQLSSATATQTIVQRFATLELLNASDTIGAPTDSSYVTLGASGSLSAERVLTGTADQVVITDNGAGATVVLSLPQNIAATSAPTFNGLTLTAKATFGATVKTPQTYTPSVSATATLDCSLGDIHRITMPAGDITIALSNITDGQTIQIAITQDGGGSRTVTWFSTIRWAGGSAPTLTTTASKRDVIVITCTGTGTYDGFVAGANI